MTAVCNSSEDGAPRSTPSALTDAQTQKLFSLCQQQPDVYDAVTIILNTGMRKGELEQLRWADIDFDHNDIAITGHKSGSSRRIPISNDVKITLQARRDRQQPPAEFVLGTRPAAVLCRVQRSLKRVALQLGIPSGLFHIMRRTWACRLVNAGIDLFVLSCLGGWSLRSWSSTRYHKLFRVNPASAAKSYRAAFDRTMAHEDEVHSTSIPDGPAPTDSTDVNPVQE
jgi:integrase